MMIHLFHILNQINILLHNWDVYQYIIWLHKKNTMHKEVSFCLQFEEGLELFEGSRDI